MLANYCVCQALDGLARAFVCALLTVSTLILADRDSFRRYVCGCVCVCARVRVCVCSCLCHLCSVLLLSHLLVVSLRQSLADITDMAQLLVKPVSLKMMCLLAIVAACAVYCMSSVGVSRALLL